MQRASQAHRLRQAIVHSLQSMFFAAGENALETPELAGIETPFFMQCGI
jgi:hypothetical protein